GASVKSVEGIRNMAEIIRSQQDHLFVVVSAMGKTTNMLEQVVEAYMEHGAESALQALGSVESFHIPIISKLFNHPTVGLNAVQPVFAQLKQELTMLVEDYDKTYDRIVSYGELISTTIITSYLREECHLDAAWLDMRQIVCTDSNFREANVRMDVTRRRLHETVDFNLHRIYIGQGFIGGNDRQQSTTLGREGSDYSAAIVGSLLGAESVTIWKDVPGILNADPRIFPNTVLLPELTYYEAVELAYSGAQVIHPKTIRPLENADIPLYVKPFAAPYEHGSIIRSVAQRHDDVPIIILRKKQILITVRPLDFSFVLENSLPRLFSILEKHRLKVSLIQSSAVTISVCVDHTRYVEDALDELRNYFSVSYNTGLELLTIRGTTPELVEQCTQNRQTLIEQHTRRTGKFLMFANEAG
ncbi:MAG: aspartate kinase, partial [Paludibacteraceae bacterium]|nr:aspartate kinase [Paludibacteraceae bacterium]